VRDLEAMKPARAFRLIYQGSEAQGAYAEVVLEVKKYESIL
jgi:hypothetical protein